MKKVAIRRLFQDKRKGLTSQERQTLDELITVKTIEELRSRQLHTVHIFLPRGQSSEIDTWPIIRWLWSQNLQVCVPYILPGTSDMLHFSILEGDKLIVNKWNIPEPDPNVARAIDPKEISAVIIPLLAFDQHGFRAGYGGGYYDRFLPLCKPGTLKIGLSYFDPLVGIEDINEYDIPMDMCVTPSEIFYWI